MDLQLFLSLLFAGIAGFSHAFEIDHLLAVNHLTQQQKSLPSAIKEGIFWGLGHTSTILAVGLLMILAQVVVSENTFHLFEAAVGFVLTLLGFHRIRTLWVRKVLGEESHPHTHSHSIAYSIGLVHGLAGSGTIVLLVMAQFSNLWFSLGYLLVFGLGSVLGMLVASGFFFLPFFLRFSGNRGFQRSLSLLSALLCIGFGSKVLFENLSFALEGLGFILW